jgi:hypothetical protein
MKTKGLSPNAAERLHHFGIPISSERPSRCWIICVDRDSERPDTRELQHLRRYRDFLIDQCCGANLRRRLSDMPLPFLTGYNTIVLKKLGKHSWVYRMMVWEGGYVSDCHIPLRIAFDFLTADIERWNQWKKSHPLCYGIH